MNVVWIACVSIYHKDKIVTTGFSVSVKQEVLHLTGYALQVMEQAMEQIIVINVNS